MYPRGKPKARPSRQTPEGSASRVIAWAARCAQRGACRIAGGAEVIAGGADVIAGGAGAAGREGAVIRMIMSGGGAAALPPGAEPDPPPGGAGRFIPV
ncbi:hypothetical protein GCM10010402_32760 [Actinomadura luteofluorescens]